MASQLEKDGIRHLKRIEKELEAIKDRTANPRRTFLNGIIYGAGAFLGGIIAISFIGWFLSILGIVPGLTEITGYVQSLVDMLPTSTRSLNR